MAAGVGMLSQLGVSTASPVDARFDFHDENLVMNEEVINANGLRGTRSHNITRCRMGLQRIAGNIRFNGTSTARLLGGAMAATLIVEEIRV